MENENQFMEEPNKAKQWLQDNLRIIISILIVVAIAGGIYSYSKRTEAPTMKQAGEESMIAQDETGATINENGAIKTTDKGTPIVTSQETADSFIESAVKGNGTTHLARRALANYLEKNPDQSLTAEHKIYIEDYLRKNVPQKKVSVGTSVEFSKGLIDQAIQKSKTLNQRQLDNLHKYAVRVPSLS